MEQSHTQRTRSMSVKQIQGNTPDSFDDIYDDDVWPSRMPTSARRYQSDVRADGDRTRGDAQPISARDQRTGSYQKSSIPARRTATQTHLPVPSTQTTQGGRRRPAPTPLEIDDITSRPSGGLSNAPKAQKRRLHWLFYVGLAMLITVLGWVAVTSALNWWQVTQDDIHYGRPRTYQTDHVVGHNDSSGNPSHFIAINLRRHIQIIEFPGGDSSKARIYVGPVLIGPGQDLSPVTLTFKDVTGDGKADMIVNVQDSRFIFINENGSFRSARPNENIHI